MPLGEIAIQILPFMKMYVTYCQNFKGALECLRRAMKKNSDFRSFVNRKNHALPDLLEAPVSRIGDVLAAMVQIQVRTFFFLGLRGGRAMAG